MYDYTNEELFEIIKSTIFKSNSGVGYISSDKVALVESVSRKNPEIYNSAVESAMNEINKQNEFNNRQNVDIVDNIKLFAEKSTIEPFNSVLNIENSAIEFLEKISTNQNLISLIVSGDSMINAGINNGDLLFAETGVELKSEDIIIAEVNGEIYVKRLKIDGNNIWLFSENPNYEPVKINSSMRIIFKGRVKAGIRMY